MAVGTVVFLAIPGPLLRLFDADAAVLAEGISALRLIALSFVCAGVSVILCAALQALGGGQFQPGGFPAAPACAPFSRWPCCWARSGPLWCGWPSSCPRGPPVSPPCCSTAAPHGAGWPVWRNKCPLPTGPEAAASGPDFFF